MKKPGLVGGIALLASVVVGGINAPPVAAAGCQAFGQEAAMVAQTGTLGQQASAAAKAGPPGVVKAFVHGEMVRLCD